MHREREQLYIQCGRRGLSGAQQAAMRSHVGVQYEPDALHPRRKLPQNLEPFASNGVHESWKSRDVAAGLIQARNQPAADGIPQRSKHDRDGLCSRRIVSVAWLVLVTITLGARPISSLAKD